MSTISISYVVDGTKHKLILKQSGQSTFLCETNSLSIFAITENLSLTCTIIVAVLFRSSVVWADVMGYR